MPKTEDDRMMAIINRDATFLGRLVNDAIDSGRMLIGKPSVWQEVRAWELREEAAKEQAAMQAMTSRAAPMPTTGLSAGQVADRLAAEMTVGQTPERAAAVLALEELAQTTEMAHGSRGYSPDGSGPLNAWADLYTQTAELATNRTAIEMLAERGIEMTSRGLAFGPGSPLSGMGATAADLQAIVEAERGRDDANLTLPAERDAARVIGGR